MPISLLPIALRRTIGAACLLTAVLSVYPPALAQPGDTTMPFEPKASSEPLDEPFRGVTTDGSIRQSLYEIRSTGVTTEPVRKAAVAFLNGLTSTQREASHFPVGDDQWRRWDNRSRPPREGISFQNMSDEQRELAFDLLRESLSARGLATSRDIMRLNETIAEITENWDAYGEWRYYMSVLGVPSASEPWGWQLNGHHLIINYFVLGDQVVMTPVFMGSEPVRAEAGVYQGTEVLQIEQDAGLAMMLALNDTQQERARIATEKGPTDNVAEAYRDNVVLDYTGIPATEMSGAQRRQLLELIGVYVGHMRDGHARVRLSEVEAHIDETHFAWIGGTDADAVFYYRIQSPVILIEFDHQRPVALSRSNEATRQHIHTVVRTPHGNDYGKDLLRQHHEHHSHGGHHHRHEHPRDHAAQAIEAE